MVRILVSEVCAWAPVPAVRNNPDTARKSSKGQNLDLGPVRPFRVWYSVITDKPLACFGTVNLEIQDI
jgi:hypothetical protein